MFIVAKKWVDFYAAAGPYYFSGKDKGCKFWGGKARLMGRIKENWTLELSNSYDKVFHDRFQCQLTFNLPFGTELEEKDEHDRCSMYDLIFSRMVQPLDRQEIIVEQHCTQRTAGINPATCQPYHFVFVNNKSNSLGTYESPYPTLALAQANSAAGDIIYVFSGDGTTKGMNEGMVLKLDQKFWGSAAPHTLQTTQGNFVIPAHSTIAPKMTSVDSYGITLAASNAISGFTITDAYEHGIYGINLSNIEVSNCTINNSTFGDQIHLEYSSSHGSANLYDLTLTHRQFEGISITSTAPSFTGTIKNSVIQKNSVYTIKTTLNNQASLSIVGNVFDHNVNGTNLEFNGPASLLMSGNTITHTGNRDGLDSSFPVLIQASDDPLFATITNNIISDNGAGGIHLIVDDTDAAHVTISGNTISNNLDGSVGPRGSAILLDPNISTTGNCYLNLLDNTISGNQASAIYCIQGSFDEFEVNAVGNTITDNSGSGFVIGVGSNNLTLTVTDNSILNNGDSGITTLRDSGSTITTANVTISNNQITGNANGFGANGVAITHTGTDLNLTITKNNISDNDGTGITVYPSIPITNVDINIANNTINNNQNLGSNGASGIDIHQYVNLSGTIANNRLSNNADPSVYVSTDDASPSVCLTMTGNSSDTGYTVDSGTGTFNLAPCNVDDVNAGTITKIGTITAVQSCPDGVAC